MKQLHYLLALAAGLIVFSCTPKVEETETTLGVTPQELTFADDDTSNKFVSVSTNGDWTASSGEGWVHLQGASGSGDGSFTVSVDANKGGAPRTGSISVKAGSLSATVSVTQGDAANALVPSPASFDGKKRSSTTYQLLVYSFADSDGDGVGDFKGIQNKLDYLDGLGVTALWLSPIHPADSYHGYDVRDYFAANPAFASGTHTEEQAEADFQALVKAAKDKGITIYIDYVLNHSGKGHPWFLDALSSPSSPYRDWYFISSNPASDYKNFPMLKGTSYVDYEWASRTAGSPQIVINKTSEAVTSGKADWNVYMWPLSGGNALDPVRFVDDGNGKYHAVLEINGNYGLLIRKYMTWDNGSKFGAGAGNATLEEGVPMNLVGDGGDISFKGSGRYRIDLSNTSTQTVYFMCAFGEWMPDLNYGNIDNVTDNACFKELAASADKWIKMGIGGFRLDAVQHICGGISSYNNVANRKFLKAWYERCNATYKAQGHSDNIFMVGEVWNSHDSVEKYYYESITSCFEFGYWPVLYKALTSQNASNYVPSVMAFYNDHLQKRADAQTSLFMTNHDHSSQTGGGEARAADDLGKNLAREKQAAAMILTSPGKPFVYQGEELGYWGNAKGKGDEYIRAPIVWDKAAKEVAKKGVNDKVDTAMLTGSISVAYQEEDAGSLLNTYKTWSRLRNTYDALATGKMTNASLGVASVAAWYMTSTDGQKLLVIHNVASGAKEVTVNDSMAHPVAVLGGASASGNTLKLGANSSVVFEL